MQRVANDLREVDEAEPGEGRLPQPGGSKALWARRRNGDDVGPAEVVPLEEKRLPG